MSLPPTADDRLSLPEVEAALRALSPADWERALRLARFRVGGLADWTGESLLSEALAKLLAGERVWRRGVSALQTLKNVLHSLASNFMCASSRAFSCARLSSERPWCDRL